MDHVAIMKKSWGLLPKILTCEKKIESRWYNVKAAPWGRIKRGDIIYFKNSGEPVTVRCEVEEVRSFEGLTPVKVWDILEKFVHSVGVQPDGLDRFYHLVKGKRYCLLIFLKNPQKITPFNINKKGFGAMAAWITVDSIKEICVNL